MSLWEQLALTYISGESIKWYNHLNFLAIPYTLKQTPYHQQSHSYVLKRELNTRQQKNWTWMFTAALLIMSINWKQLNCSFIGKWIGILLGNEMNYWNTQQHKRKNHTKWKKPHAKCCTVWFNSRNSPSTSNRKQISDGQKQKVKEENWLVPRTECLRAPQIHMLKS